MTKETHRNALPRGFKLEEYEIEALLGHGGFGITYLARDIHLNQHVAIKEYLPGEFAVREGISTVYAKSTSDEEAFQWGLQRFIKEAQTLAQFKHPNIMRVQRFFEAHGTAYMVMEYEEGMNLSEWLQGREFTEDGLLKLLLPLLEGLQKVHEAGFLHRDIKPQNIFIRNDGTPVLLDFGAARYAVGQRSTSLTSIVSPGYAPFEQYDANSPQGPWTDIYALGAVMYYAVTGKKPQEVVSRLKHDDMTRLASQDKPEFRTELLKAIDWALALDEQARPQSVSEWRETLLAPPAQSGFLQPKARGGRWIRPLLLLALILLIPCAYFTYQKYGSALFPSIPERQPVVPIDESNVRKFIGAYLKTFNKTDESALVDKFYAEEVNYYTWGPVTKDVIKKEKQEFFSKWPVLDYTLAEDLQIKDAKQPNLKRVNFSINFLARNPQTGKQSQGLAMRIWTLRSRPVEGLKIIDENEHIIRREKQTIPSSSPKPD